MRWILASAHCVSERRRTCRPRQGYPVMEPDRPRPFPAFNFNLPARTLGLANQTLNDKDKEVDHDERRASQSVEQAATTPKLAIEIQSNALSVISRSGRCGVLIADKDLKDCTNNLVGSVLDRGSARGRRSVRIRLVLDADIAAPPHRVPFRMFTHPLCNVRRRTHCTLLQRTTPVKKPGGLLRRWAGDSTAHTVTISLQDSCLTSPESLNKIATKRYNRQHQVFNTP